MKEKLIMWGAVIGLAILLFLPSKANALTKDEIKQHVQNTPFDFEQISKDAEAYKTLLFRERERRLQFVEIDKYPTQQERRTFYILHAIDVGMTIWALNNRDNVKEGNIFLSNDPTNRALITNKLLTIPIYQNSNQPQIVVMNYITGTVIVHNMYVIAKYD
jgi:hypothetical protein